MMNEKELPTTFTDESLNVDASETSKDQEPPEPNKPSNTADSLEEAFFEDNLKPKIEPVSYDGVNVSESRTDENEKDTEHAGKSLNAFSGEDEPGTPNDEVRSKPNTLENKADSLETTSFEDNSETKDKLQKFEVILERKIDADENEMDTSHDSNNMNGFSNDPSEKSKDDVTVDQYSKIKRKHAKHGDVLQETVHSKGVPKDRDNKQVIFKSIKDEEMLELVGNKHKQKWAVKDMMEHSQSENKHIKDDDIFLETIKIDHDLENNLKEVPGALDYIRKLHHLIHKHIKKIRKLRKKLCEQTSKQYKDSFTQTVVEPQQTKAEPGATEKENKIEVESKPKSLAEDIAEAAQMAVQNSGFVYEETSGMYYDYNTGYYYNAEYGLYYDGSTGTYMSYNQDTQSYEFHSQVSVPPNQQTEKKPDRRKRKNKGNTSKVKPISCDLSSLEQSFSRLSIDNLRSTALGTYQLSNTLYSL
ncbi:unnamed protein product [Callosobruchus maculatus]|uniref:OCRE domain-containing protein n=1 Tax=Callosobruchus maculatus TaxID=64391 RepID=A0A653CGZ5_CALMS|nr:unnamed protein product [Callosobruchus maculatus]